MVGFHAMREQQSLLGEIALDLGAKRSFPRPADHNVENGSAGGDDDEEDGEQLEEDAVLQCFLADGEQSALSALRRGCARQMMGPPPGFADASPSVIYLGASKR